MINVVLNLILCISNYETAITSKYKKSNGIEKRQYYEDESYFHPDYHFIVHSQFIPVLSFF